MWDKVWTFIGVGMNTKILTVGKPKKVKPYIVLLLNMELRTSLLRLLKNVREINWIVVNNTG